MSEVKSELGVDWFQLPDGTSVHFASISSVRCAAQMYGHMVDIWTSTGMRHCEVESKEAQTKLFLDLHEARVAYHDKMKTPLLQGAGPFVRPPKADKKDKQARTEIEVSFEPDGPHGHERWRLDLHDLIDDHEHYTDKIEWDSDSLSKLRKQVQGAIDHLQTMDRFLMDVQDASKIRKREKRTREAAEANANKKAKTSA